MRIHHSLLSALCLLPLAACVVEEEAATTETEKALWGTSYYTYYACDDRGCEPTRKPDPSAPFVAECGARACLVTSDDGHRTTVDYEVARTTSLAMIAAWREARQVDATYPWGGGPHPYYYDAQCVWANQLDLVPVGGACPDTGGPLDPPTCGTGGPCPPEPDCDISPLKCASCSIELVIRLSGCAAGGPLYFPYCAIDAGLDFEDCVDEKCEC